MNHVEQVLPKAHFAKGSYFSLAGRAPFRRLIYPAPQDAWLGVHLTLDLAGQARFGPDVQWLVPHQANIRIIEAMGKKLGLPRERVVVTVDRHANTSAASVPLALDTAVRDGRIKSGDLVMLEAMGGGFTWGASLLRV